MVGNSALLPSEVKNFLMMPTQRFWLGTVSLLDAIALKVTNKSTRCWEKISSYIQGKKLSLVHSSETSRFWPRMTETHKALVQPDK